MEPIPGTDVRLQGNVEIRVITNIQVFYAYAKRTIDLVEQRRLWCERNPKRD